MRTFFSRAACVAGKCEDRRCESANAAEMNTSDSQQDLLSNEAAAPPSALPLQAPIDYVLSPIEKHFLLSAERGDCATVKR